MNVGHIISTSPPIAENIFKYLNASDLCSCAKVCSLWNRIAQTEKKRRMDIGWFFQGLHCVKHNKIHSSCRECCMNLTRDIEDDLHKLFETLRVEPHFCIAFASTGFLTLFEELCPNFRFPSKPAKKKPRNDSYYMRRYLKAVKEFVLKPYLPSWCPVIFAVSPGIVGCRTDALPIEIEEGSALSGLLFPQVPGFDILHFAVDGRNCNVANLIPKDTSVKCLLVFLTERGGSLVSKLVHSCLEREKYKVAVGGAFVDRSESLLGSIIAFCGPNVEAASVILKPEDKKEQFEDKLRCFEKTGLLKNRCFAFMFACVARGFFLHREYNLESSIFHKVYPHVPLIGLFGNGEIGVNYLPTTPVDMKDDLHVPSVERYFHSYSTVFVLVSIKM